MGEVRLINFDLLLIMSTEPLFPGAIVELGV